MARVYATITDYRTYTGNVTAEVDEVLFTRASAALDANLIGVRYTTDTSGLPTDVGVAGVFRDCVCAIVQWWDENGDTTGTGAASGWQSASLGSASYSKGGQATMRNTSTAIHAGNLPPTAVDLLAAAGLLHADPQILG